MNDRDQYLPGPAAGAEVRKDAEKWTLIVTRQLRQPPEQVWKALTDPASLREWAPFDADRSLGAVGPVRLSTVGTPTPQASNTPVTRAEPPSVLEYDWSRNHLRWTPAPRSEEHQSETQSPMRNSYAVLC